MKCRGATSRPRLRDVRRKVEDAARLLQLVVNGAAAGCVYGLIALGFVLIYKATEMVNFAQGDIMMLGGFLAY